MEGLRERHLGNLQGLFREEAPRIQPEAYKVFTSGLMDTQIPVWIYKPLLLYKKLLLYYVFNAFRSL